MWDKDKKVLGVIGGMGPAASQLFYQQIIEKTQASCDQDHVDMIILNHASMPDRTEAILSGQGEKLLGLLLEDAKRLESYGAAAIAIPCNTAHFFADQIQAEIGIPLINMIKGTAKEVATNSRKMSKVGILATDGTVRQGLYQKACRAEGIETVTPTAKTQGLVMKIIYDGIKGGGKIDYDDFIAIERELAAQGCNGAIMGCTELSVFKRLYHLPDYYIDAMGVLAERSIEACGKKVLRERQP